MNIPLINSNSKQDINTSLIAIRNAINELSRMKESASVEDLQRQINIINQQIANFNSEFSAINTHLNTIDTNILNLQPVDTVASGNLHSVTSNAVAQRFASRKVIIWEGTATEGDTLDFSNIDMNINNYERLEIILSGELAHLLVSYSVGTGNNVRLKAWMKWTGTDIATNIGKIDYDQTYIVDIINSKLVNCGWYQRYNWEVGGTLNSNVINLGENVFMKVWRVGNVATVTIEAVRGSNIPTDQAVLVATGLPIVMAITNCIVKLDDINRYQRAWIDYGNLYIWISGSSNYTGNVFITTTYTIPDYPMVKGGTFNISKIIGYKL